MVSVEQYYNKLYKNLVFNHKEEFDYCLVRDNSTQWLSPSGEKYMSLNRVLDEVKWKYGFDMKFNHTQLTVWQRAFHVFAESEISKKAYYASGILVLFCCLVDNFLDSPRFSQCEKKTVCKTIENFEGTVLNEAIYPELDWLLNQFLDFINDTPEDELYSKSTLFKELKKAFDSEVYMYKSVLQKDIMVRKEEFSSLTDKSVAFEKVALLTALYGSISSESLKAAEAMGNIFWLIDDLCDFVEDIRAKRKNSLLIFGATDSDSYELEKAVDAVYHNIEIPINMLFHNLDTLRDVAGDDLYIFMMNQIWKWSFRVREFVEGKR